MEEWEEEAIYKACCVAEARMMENYSDLAFYDLDNKVTCTVYPENLEWVKKTRGIKGYRNRWAFLGTHPDMDDDDKTEPFDISELVKGLIVSTPQERSVHFLQKDDRDVEGDEEEEDTMDAGLGGYQDMS